MSIVKPEELETTNVKKGELGFPLGSKFNDISFLTTMMECVMIPKSHLLLLYRMMKDTHDLFVKNKIPYFIDGGSLLGAIRHKGLIPWDDDLDIGILPKDMHKLKKVFRKLKKKGYGVETHNSIFKVFIGNKWIISPIKYSANPTLDIFVYHKKGDYIQLQDPNLYNKWPEARYKHSEMFPLKLYDFGPFKVYAAKNGRGYCNRLYPNWERDAVIELRAAPEITSVKSKERKVTLPMKLTEIFIPNYNVTSDDVKSVKVDFNRLDPNDI